MTSRLDKPLPSQEIPEETARAKRQQEVNRLKRKTKHEADKDSRPPEKRLMARTDMNERVTKIYTLDWLEIMRSATVHFAEFTKEKLFMQPGDERHGSQYFVLGGPVPSQELVRLFIYYYADSTAGTVQSQSWRPSEAINNDKISVQSIQKVADTLISALSY